MQFIMGVVAGLFVWVVQVFFVKVIVPWYEDKGINAVKVKGKWNVKYKGKNDIVSTLELRQSRTKVRGDGQVTLSRNGRNPEEERHYIYEGRMLNDSLVLWFDNKVNACHTGGAICFYFPDKNNTSLMYGKAIFYKNDIADIDVVEYVMEKSR